ncbi:MAG: hypothetical protein GQE15_35735 [Archangiaceae bacterium]|nr:hypothetical protein [Archangiaceae bacterium]
MLPRLVVALLFAATIGCSQPGEASAAQVRWSENSVAVDGVQGSWLLEPCRYVAPAAPPALPY